MNIIGMLDRPSSGTLSFRWEKVARLGEKKSAKSVIRKLALSFSSFPSCPKLNALQNVELPLIYAGVSQSKRKAQQNNTWKKLS